MPQRPVTLGAFIEFDNGKVAAAFDHEMRQMVRDVTDRPGDKSRRTVQLTVEMVPKLEKDKAALDTVAFRVQITSRAPVRKSIVYEGLPTNEGRLLVQTHSPTNPRQTELPYGERIDPKTGEVLPADPIPGDAPAGE